MRNIYSCTDTWSGDLPEYDGVLNTFDYRIVSARRDVDWEGRPTLRLDLRGTSGEESHSLHGEELFRAFMMEMGVQSPQDLEGRTISGVYNLQGFILEALSPLPKK